MFLTKTNAFIYIRLCSLKKKFGSTHSEVIRSVSAWDSGTVQSKKGLFAYNNLTGTATAYLILSKMWWKLIMEMNDDKNTK